MQSLLEDSVFYNLLVNNQESLVDKSSEEASIQPSSPDLTEKMQQQMVYPGQHLIYHQQNHQLLQQQEMFPQQHNFYEHHTEPPLRNGFDQMQAYQHQQMLRFPPPPPLQQNNSTRSSGDTSYQPSVFSDNLSITTDSLEGVNYQHQNMPQVDEFFVKEQIRSEIGQDTIQKRFHRYYTTGQHGSNITNLSPQLKPSLPITTPNRDFHMVKKPTGNYHKCPFCQRSFKNKSYLSRHLKKHDTIKDYKCPFFSAKHTKCHHLNGEFSRKDTFKAHLKSIHFIYPIGVAKSDRNESPGRCAGCFKEFDNNNDWLIEHIEREDCSGFAKFKTD